MELPSPGSRGLFFITTGYLVASSKCPAAPSGSGDTFCEHTSSCSRRFGAALIVIVVQIFWESQQLILPLLSDCFGSTVNRNEWISLYTKRIPLLVRKVYLGNADS